MGVPAGRKRIHPEKQKGRVPLAVQSDTRLKTVDQSILGVTRAQHGGEAGRLQLSSPPLAGLLEVPVIAHFFQRAFAINLLFEPPQRLFY
jgi:hypothetical protein